MIKTKYINDVDYGNANLNQRISAFPKNIQLFFQRKKQEDCTESTLLSYAKHLKTLGVLFRKKDLLKLKPEEFDNFMLNKPKDVKPSTISAWMSAFKELYRFATARQLIENPQLDLTHKVKVGDKSTPCYLYFRHGDPIRNILEARRQRVWDTTTSLKKLQKTMREELTIRLKWDTGCRTNEVIKITVNDIVEAKVQLKGALVEVPFCTLRNSKAVSGAPTTRQIRIRPDTFSLFKEYVKLASAEVKKGNRELIDVTERKVQNMFGRLHKELLEAGYNEIKTLESHDTGGN